MNGFTFDLQRFTNTVTSMNQHRVSFWRGQVGGLGFVELVVPALEIVSIDERKEREGAMVTGESIPVSTYTGLPYEGRPRLARGRLSVAGRDAAFPRKSLRSSRGERALRIWAVGREYRYRE